MKRTVLGSSPGVDINPKMQAYPVDESQVGQNERQTAFHC
ncbi:unnamed protein product [Schistosoma margrebowiei]|uniref:Uncharacterized protein n=1 Tax=Schistosoma margrebowiei TaxID=48269 RepID=A0A3P8B8Z0_9TREM|nr:unnamed protein product [Schistosoma margrebowiei]